MYMVKAITRSPWPKESGDIDTQIDSVMQNSSLSISGYRLIECRRESDIYLVEDLEGITYQHVGGLYRIIADES